MTRWPHWLLRILQVLGALWTLPYTLVGLLVGALALAQGESAEQALKAMAHRLTNKLIHAPTQALRHHGHPELDRVGHDDDHLVA